MELEPRLGIARTNYALMLYQLGDVKESLRNFKNLARRYPQFADVRAAATAVLWSEGKIGEAESNWVAAAGLDPRYRDVDWVANIRRWPPAMVEALDSFLNLN